MENKKKNWKCKLGFHNWNYLPEYHGFKEGGEFLKNAIFLGHIKQIRQCKECNYLQAKQVFTYSSSHTSRQSDNGTWYEYNEVMEFIKDNFVKDNRMRAW